MNPLEIILIILGIIVIIVSSRMVDRTQYAAGRSKIPLDEEIKYSEEEINQSREKLNELLTKVSEETVVRTDDYLSRLSNEKIMAVGEYADQIMEKIKNNHEEVVFLYNMLNDKEKELKSAVKEIDSSKKKVQEIVESKKKLEDKPVKKASASNQLEKQAENLRSKAAELPKAPDNAEASAKALGENSNSQILDLYSQGKSVVEISKLLGLGQGEVKLVIELFRGKK